jgi:hypothetical protein
MKITTLPKVVIWGGGLGISTSLSLLRNPNLGACLDVHFVDAVIALADVCNILVLIHVFLLFVFY